MATQTIGDQDTDKTFRELTSKEHLAKTGHNAKDQKPLREQEEKAAGQSGAGTQATPEASPRSLGRAENSPEENGGFYRGDDRKRNGKTKFSLKKRVGIASGVAGLGMGGVLFGLVFFAPAAKLVHLAEILKLDTSNNEDSSSRGINRLFRYVRTGNLGVTRVSWLGEKIFNSARTQLADIGVTFTENTTFGNLKTITFDITKHPELKGMTRDQARAYLAKQFKSVGITEADIKNASGTKLTINSRRVGISATRAILKSSLAQLNDGKIMTWLRMRNLTKFYNLPSIFHPWKRVDAKVDSFLASRAEVIKREAERRKKVSKSSVTEAKAEAARTALRAKWSGFTRIASGALLFTAAVCLIRDSSDEALAFNHNAIVAPAAVGAAEIIAMESQTQSDTDFALSQWADASMLLGDPDGLDVFDSKPLQAKIDPFVQTGIDLPIEYIQAFGTTTANTLRNAGGEAGAVACSTPGQIVQVAGGLALLISSAVTGGGTGGLYAGLKTIGTMAVSAAVTAGIYHLVTEWLEADPLENISAPLRGGVLAYGSRELNNINERSRGGVRLSGLESKAIDIEIAQRSKEEFQAKPFLARMFDTSDYRSLASIVIDSQSSKPIRQLQNMATGLFNFRLLSSGISNMLKLPVAYAGNPYDWGFTRYGIPARILNNDAYDDPYANADYVASHILTTNLHDEYVERADKCFGVSVSTIDSLWSVRPVHEVDPNSREYEEGRCDEVSENWDRFILFIYDSSNMEAAACFEGDADACAIVTGRRQ